MTDKAIILDIKQQLRDILILEYGAIWFDFCEKTGVSDDLRMQYIDYLNSLPDAIL